MAISNRQKKLVQQSFEKVEPIAEQAAEIFYSKLFDYDPSLKKLFKRDMKNQGQKLMATLKVAVKSLDDLDSLVPVLQSLAVKHVDYGVSVDDYTPVGNALINTLKAGLGDAFTDDVRDAWIEVYKTIAAVMRDAAYKNFDAASYKNKKSYNH